MDEQTIWVIEHRTTDPKSSDPVGIVTPSQTGDRIDIVRQWILEEVRRYDYGSGYFAVYDIKTNSHDLIDSNITYFTLDGENLEDQPCL